MGLLDAFKKNKDLNEVVVKPILDNFDSNYFVGKKLGSGGFAVVKEAVRKSDSQKFAVKIVELGKLKGTKESLLPTKGLD